MFLSFWKYYLGILYIIKYNMGILYIIRYNNALAFELSWLDEVNGSYICHNVKSDYSSHTHKQINYNQYQILVLQISFYPAIDVYTCTYIAAAAHTMYIEHIYILMWTVKIYMYTCIYMTLWPFKLFFVSRLLWFPLHWIPQLTLERSLTSE